MTMIENECFNCVKMVCCKVTTIDSQKGYRLHKGHWGLLGGVGVLGLLGGVRGALEVYWGAGRECT